MATAALIAVGVLSVIVFVLLSALVELFRDVRQIRDALGILDRPIAVDIGSAANTPPGSYGLPHELDEAKAALLVFLSDRCSTCRVLAASLGGALPAGLWIVVEAASGQAAADFVEAYGMTSMLREQRVIIDPAGAMAARLGLKTAPVGCRTENGVFKDAATVPSVRTLLAMIPRPTEDAVDVSSDRRLSMFARFLDPSASGLTQFGKRWRAGSP